MAQLQEKPTCKTTPKSAKAVTLTCTNQLTSVMECDVTAAAALALMSPTPRHQDKVTVHTHLAVSRAFMALSISPWLLYKSANSNRVNGTRQWSYFSSFSLKGQMNISQVLTEHKKYHLKHVSFFISQTTLRLSPEEGRCHTDMVLNSLWTEACFHTLIFCSLMNGQHWCGTASQADQDTQRPSR